MAQVNRKTTRKHIKLDRVTIGLLIAFMILAVVTGVVAFNLARNLVSSWTITSVKGAPILPTVNPSEVDNNTAPLPSGALQPSGGPVAEPWDGVSRVTILIMGLDYRDWEAGDPPRSDTMILFTMDPLSKTAAMLSIPRDMWVYIPGFDYAKINTAYFLGEVNQLPGGGPGLAVETVEQFLGVPINYYAQIDFSAFVRVIDEIKGVKVYVEEPMDIDPIGQDADVHLDQGWVTLNGDLALAYARARYIGNGDFDRAKRQQQVILAVRDRILSFDMLPTLITKAPKLYQEVSDGIRTNLDIEQALKLAQFVMQIDSENIKSYVIGPEQVEFGMSADGQDILIPIPDEIRLLRDEAFTTGGPVSPAAVGSDDPLSLVKEENARISIQNGTGQAGLASQTGDYLKSLGYNVVEETDGPSVDITTIYQYNGMPYTIQALFDLLDDTGNLPRLFNKADDTGQLDVTIVLGWDWANYIATHPLPES